jgi:dynein heavy chain
MCSVELYSLPKKEAWSLDRFLSTVKEKCKQGTALLDRKNKMVENSVEEIIYLAMESMPGIADQKRENDTGTDAGGGEGQGSRRLQKKGSNCSDLLAVRDSDLQLALAKIAQDIRRNYSRKVLENLETITRNSLKNLTKYFASSVVESIGREVFDFEDDDGVDYAFELVTVLEIPNVEVRPSLEDLQAHLVTAGNMILSVSKGVEQWDRLITKKKVNAQLPEQAPICESKKEMRLYNPVKAKAPLIVSKSNNFYSSVMENKEVVKALAQLSSCMAGMKMELTKFNQRWQKYSEVWTTDMDDFLNDFITAKPGIYDFDRELKKFNMIEAELDSEQTDFHYGKMIVKTHEFKQSVKNEIRQWINLIGRAMQMKYRSEMNNIIAQINDLDKKLDRPMNDLDDIRIIMETQKKIRESEIDLDMKIELVENAFTMMCKYELPLRKDDANKAESLQETWMNVQQKAMQTYVLLLEVQEHFKTELKKSITIFQQDCDAYIHKYNTNGPMEPGLSPREASDRLEAFQSQFDSLWRKHTSYSVGEEMFGLPHTDQKEIENIKKELNLMHRLYKLYNDVIESVNSYQAIIWKSIDVEEISNELMEYQNRCRKLPKGLKEWPAFHDLKKIIDDFSDICPILELMSNKAMKPRHWQRIESITKYKIDLERTGFALRDMMEAPLLKHKEDIEDVCISAMKEKDIEAKLKGVVSEWSSQECLIFTKYFLLY